MAATVDYRDPSITKDFRFRRYVWKERVNDGQVIAIHHTLLGLTHPDRPRAIRRHLDYNTFEVEWTPIPPGYKKKKVKADFVEKVYCSKVRARLAPGNPRHAAVEAYVRQNNAAPLKYFTHDNGGRPFLVYASPAPGGERVTVYLMEHGVPDSPYYVGWENLDSGGDDSWAYVTRVFETVARRVFETVARRVFVGESPLCEMTAFSGGHGPDFDGNSVLLEMPLAAEATDPLDYVFIGSNIYRFEALEPIAQFLSPVGNNDVPYPYAVDRGLNYYLLGEGVRVRFSWVASPDTAIAAPADPYTLHYGHAAIEGLSVSRARLSLTLICKRPGGF